MLKDKLAYFNRNSRLGNVDFTDEKFLHLEFKLEEGTLVIANPDCSKFNSATDLQQILFQNDPLNLTDPDCFIAAVS